MNQHTHPLKLSNFQLNVHNWMLYTFGTAVAQDVSERCHRLLEETLELVQSLRCTASEAHQLVDYVFSRPVGEPSQELGGTAVCLAAAAHAAGLDLTVEADKELAHNWKNAEKIRAKWLTKPKHSPLPQPVNILSDRTVAHYFLDNHQDIDLKHLDALTDLIRRARNDGVVIADELHDDAATADRNSLVEAKERAEEECRLMRAVIEAGDDLYASLIGCDELSRFQKTSVDTYAQVSNAYRKPGLQPKTHLGRSEENVPYQVPHIVINEKAHGYD